LFAGILFVSQSARAASVTLFTVDLMALRSDGVALLVVARSSDDSLSEFVGERQLDHRVLRVLRGQPPATPMRFRIWRDTDLPFQVGDTLLWIREVSLDPDPDPDEKEDATRDQHLFDLTDLKRTPLGSIALTRDFRVIHDPAMLLEVVSKRLKMAEAGNPLGDRRSYSATDFARTRGAIMRMMPPYSEAQTATDGGSENSLCYPADADLLPGLLRETRDKDPWTRASAAEALAQYPGGKAEKRLKELLDDEARVQILTYRGKGEVDTVLVPVVKKAAQKALRQMGKSPAISTGVPWRD